MAKHFQAQNNMTEPKRKVMFYAYAVASGRFKNKDLAKIATIWAMDTFKQKGSYYGAPADRWDRRIDFEFKAVQYLVTHVKEETLMQYLSFVWHFNRLAGLQ